MDITAYIEEIKLKLSGSVLSLELDDATLSRIVNASLRELQRYIDSTEIITVPYQSCIDMSPYKPNSVSRVYRAKGYGVGDSSVGINEYDPMYMGMWQMMSGTGNLANINNWTYNYGSWNTALQIRNTLSTDLIFRYDRTSNNLYINCAFDHPENITIEYVPRYDDVSEVKSDFWIDVLMRLSVANTKIVLGRIRSRFTQSNALWSQDTNILQEGLDELSALRQSLQESSCLLYPVD